MSDRHPPQTCPVCSATLAITRLGCDECATELSGHFASCEFCALSGEDRDLLRTFLASRGNMKALERHLGVSYPTARARVDGLLERLGIGDEPRSTRTDVLESLARGELSVDEALEQL